MTRGDRQPATHFATRLLLGLARVATLVWLAPALLFNVDWTGHGTWQANTAAVFMILGSALFIEGALRLRSWVLSPICIVAALFLVYVNTKQATRVLSVAGEAESEAKAASIAEGVAGDRKGSQLQKRRDEQAKIAGETAVGALEAQLHALQLSDVRTWNATDSCGDVTTKASGAFCARVAEARAKIEAAKERDRLDVQITALPTPKVLVAPGAEAPVVDPYVANVLAISKEFGFRPSERLVKAEEALARALGFELLAALGPTCWLAFVNMLAAGGGAAARVRKGPNKPDASKAAAVGGATAFLGNADDHDRCIADLFETESAGVMAAKEIRPFVQTWFSARGLKLNESKLWSKLGERFKRDRNKGRPRYLGLKVRAKGRLAVVARSGA